MGWSHLGNPHFLSRDFGINATRFGYCCIDSCDGANSVLFLILARLFFFCFGSRSRFSQGTSVFGIWLGGGIYVASFLDMFNTGEWPVLLVIILWKFSVALFMRPNLLTVMRFIGPRACGEHGRCMSCGFCPSPIYDCFDWVRRIKFGRWVVWSDRMQGDVWCWWEVCCCRTWRFCTHRFRGDDSHWWHWSIVYRNVRPLEFRQTDLDQLDSRTTGATNDCTCIHGVAILQLWLGRDINVQETQYFDRYLANMSSDLLWELPNEARFNNLDHGPTCRLCMCPRQCCFLGGWLNCASKLGWGEFSA